VGIQFPGGFRFIKFPAWLAIVWCAALPVILTVVVQRKSKGREPQWEVALRTLCAAWLLWTMFFLRSQEIWALLAWTAMLLMAGAGSLRLKRILFHISAGISVLLPLAVALGVIASPIHLGSHRFWVAVDDVVAIYAPSGSTFRAVAGWESWEFFGLCAFLPVLWISRMGFSGMWTEQKNRWKRMLLAGLFAGAALSVMLLVLPIRFHHRFVFGILQMVGIAGALSGVVQVASLFSGKREIRRKRGQCVQCGYNLTGNISGVCPECGQRIAILERCAASRA